MKYLAFALLLCFSIKGLSEVQFTIIQTSDIHSHFINRENAYGLGGLARVAGKVNEIRSQRQNTLFLDAGDWSEGAMFFTLGSGERTENILTAMKYDVIVLGNHDWLVGPKVMYDTFERAHFSIPVVSANLDMSGLPPEVPLQNYIHPYVIKEIQGVKIGILGLSTFELIYDSYFSPVKIQEPVDVAKKYVKELKEEQKCDVIFLLTHLGLPEDQKIADQVEGIDMIIGGHNHIIHKPTAGDKVPISHVGKWGQFVGQIDAVYDKGTFKIADYHLHKMDSSVAEDPTIKVMVDGGISELAIKYAALGDIFNDQVVETQVNLPLRNRKSENTLTNWMLDSMREAAGTDLALDVSSFSARDLFVGKATYYDIFNAFPHIYSPTTDKCWTVHTFDIDGLRLQILLAAVFEFGLNISVSNANVVTSSDILNPIIDLKIGGENINWFRTYHVAVNDALLHAVDTIEWFGIPLGTKNHHDSGVEVWKNLAEFLRKKSPITPDQAKWEGRIRTREPDLQIRAEDMRVEKLSATQVQVTFTVRNAGMTKTRSSVMSAAFSENFTDTLALPAHPQSRETIQKFKVSPLAPAQTFLVNTTWDVSRLTNGRFPIEAQVNKVKGEANIDNNHVEAPVDIK